MGLFKLSLKTKTGYEGLSCSEISSASRNLAHRLIGKIGIKKNDRVAILSESRPEFAVGIFASMQSCAITVPLDIKLTVDELVSILSDCNPRVLLCSNSHFETAVQLKERVKSIEQILMLESVLKIKPDTSKDSKCSRSMDDTALIVYTSGTTGKPKGVMVSYGNINSQIRDFKYVFNLKQGTTAVSILPLNHLLELTVGLFGALYIGVKIVYIKTHSPKELLNVMREKRVTNMLIVPSVAKILKNNIEKEVKKQSMSAQFDFMYRISKYLPRRIRRLLFKSIIDGFGGRLDCFICGGAALDFKIGEFFERIGIPIYQGYGLSETGPTVSTNYPGHNKIGTVGKPLPSVKVKIADNLEILVKGTNVMQGYYGNPEMTAEAIDKDGWLHTGDIGKIDKDGYLSITGRLRNIIVLGDGKKVFPEEVETVLEKSTLLKEVCVFALKAKSGKKANEEEVGVIVVPNESLIRNNDAEIQRIIEKEIRALSAESLAYYKHPVDIIFTKQDLPKTSTGKVKRGEVLKLYERLRERYDNS